MRDCLSCGPTSGTRPMIAAKVLWVGMILCLIATPTPASSVWISDKVISESVEHDYRAAEISIVCAPAGTFVVNWTTSPYFSSEWRAQSVQFALDGTRLRTLVEFQHDPNGVSFRHNLQAAISPDSSVIMYAWSSQDYGDTVLYQSSCWSWILDFLTGSPLTAKTRLDSADELSYNIFADGQKVEFVSDTVATVFWREDASGGEPPHQKRYLQRVSIGGQLVGARVDINKIGNYPCEESDSCSSVADWIPMAVLADGNLLIAHDAAGFIGEDIYSAYSVGRLFSSDLVELTANADILMCEGYPCSSFTGFYGVSQFVDVDAFPNGGFAVAVNVGYDWNIEYTHFPGGRAFDSLFFARSPMVGAQDHSPGEVWFSPRVVCSPYDEYAVVWLDRGVPPTGGTDLWAQRFTRDGQAIGVNQRINNIAGVAGGNLGVLSAAFVDGHLVVTHFGEGAFVGVEGPGYPVFPLMLQVMPWNKIGDYAPGDVDQNDSINTADIIKTVNYVFKSGAAPKPQAWAGDVDGNCIVTASDIIYSVNHVFKAGPAPTGDCSQVIPYVPQ
jgi:hypothetical protein